MSTFEMTTQKRQKKLTVALCVFSGCLLGQLVFFSLQTEPLAVRTGDKYNSTDQQMLIITKSNVI